MIANILSESNTSYQNKVKYEFASVEIILISKSLIILIFYNFRPTACTDNGILALQYLQTFFVGSEKVVGISTHIFLY